MSEPSGDARSEPGDPDSPAEPHDDAPADASGDATRTRIDTAVGGPHDGVTIRRRGPPLVTDASADLTDVSAGLTDATDESAGSTDVADESTDGTDESTNLTDESTDGTDELTDGTDESDGVAGDPADSVTESADVVVVVLHGRTGTASGMLALTDSFGTERVAYLAPTAAGRDWYPGPLVDPPRELVDDEPETAETANATRSAHLDSAVSLIDQIVSWAAERVGRDRVVLLGFEQGGCLAAEWLARTPARCGGVVCLSGALVSPPDGQTIDPDGPPADPADGTPVLLSCATNDDRLPVARVRETATQFEQMGRDVDCRLHDGSPLTLREADTTAARATILSTID